MRHPHPHHEQHDERHQDRHQWRHHPDSDGSEDLEGRDERGERRRGRTRRGGPGGPGPWGAWGPGGPGFGGHQGPPPWVAGFFGADLGGRGERGGPGGPGGRRGGPRVRRGDVRHAILDVLREATDSESDVNGYQVIQRIAERSGEQWKPSPGSVYPTIQQLQDEGLVSVDEARRRALGLTDEGRTYVADHADQFAAVWAPFDAGYAEDAGDQGRSGDLRPQIGQMMAAVWQIASAGTPAQREAAAEVLADTRRKLYGILADGNDPAGS